MIITHSVALRTLLGNERALTEKDGITSILHHVLTYKDVRTSSLGHWKYLAHAALAFQRG